jgi:hypothetical protein
MLLEADLAKEQKPTPWGVGLFALHSIAEILQEQVSRKKFETFQYDF